MVNREFRRAVLFAWIVILTLAGFSRASAQLLKPGEVIYSRATQGGNCLTAAIWVVGLDGSNDRFITTGLHPRISPDGRYLLFKRFSENTACGPFTNGAPEFWIRELATGRETLLVQNFAISTGHFFSPDTNRADSQIITSDGGSVCTTNLDGSNRFCVSPPNLSPINSPGYMTVRSDGLTVIQNYRDVTERDGLYTINYDGLSNPIKIPNTGHNDADPTWSNDGQQIAYALFSDSGRAQPYWLLDLFKINPDGTGKIQLTHAVLPPSGEGFSYGMVWTLDNTMILNAAKLDGVAGIYKIDANGGGVLGMVPITPGSVPEWVGGIVPAYGERQVASFGGGLTSGDAYTLVDTVGQGFAGQASTGDSYNFQSGFWTIDGATPTATPTGSPTATSTPTATPTFTPTPTSTPTATATSTPDGRTGFDYDGDGKSDISVFRPSDGAWYLQRSLAGLYGTLFGFSDDRTTPADYDGDGKTDIAVYRPSTGIWYIFQSSDGDVRYEVFGLPEDLPVPADYDGDGIADIAVFRPSTATWYIKHSSDGSFYARQFGLPEDKPTVGDFDGDTKADIAIFRPSVGAWYQIHSSDDSLAGEQFGFGSDVIAPADYDGDSKTDIAIYRPSTGIWYIHLSSTGDVVYNVFGLATDIPAPGDFDGDGKADISVFRPTTGVWYRSNSSDGSFFAYPFGTAGDRPTQTAFRY